MPMKVCRQILGTLGLLLGVAGLLLSLVVGVGVWVVRGPLTTRATRIYDRVDAALDHAKQGLDHAQQSLIRAGESLESVKEQRKKLPQKPGKVDPTRMLVGRMIKEKLGPNLDEAHQKLQTVAEAAVVVNSVLDDLGNFPELSVTGLETDRLADMNARLAKMIPAVWEWSRFLSDEEPEAEADAQSSRVEQSLQSLREWITEYQTQVKQVRQRATEVQTRTLSWIMPAAILISLVSFWIGLSQISILARVWSWFRPKGRNP